ncbi:hypothetical protein [Paractinoplanes rishiriensis]|uniref:Uncharacterized protein n=1 Tax=Paractinoplanes rishiriensis TaxID=1050105 RepID=A0A919JYX9_9ACTN|nr:hypothetical protein [Actinoplanes rishiriensis]GIE95643.1 hypothetical protein Ari01nite_31080 [Actinoplanes rishiriensis]
MNDAPSGSPAGRRVVCPVTHPTNGPLSGFDRRPDRNQTPRATSARTPHVFKFRAMRGDIDETAVRTLAKEIVAAVAPEELRMFSLQADEYFEDPRNAFRLDGDSDDMLGIGVGDVLPVVTPIVLAISAEVVRYLSDSVVQAAANRSLDAARAAVQRMIRPRKTAADQTPVLDLPPGTEVTVRRIVTEISVKGQVSEDMIRMITDLTIGAGANEDAPKA